MIKLKIYILFTIIINKYCAIGFDSKGFDDTILYTINWKDDFPNEKITNEVYDLQLSEDEHYACIIPSLSSKESEENQPYNGPNPLELLTHLFHSSACSLRIESYWTYEICHGNYIKQYHEEREGKVMKTQEYFLGKWDKIKSEALNAKLEKAEKDNEKLKYKKIEKLNLPYLEIDMDDGTFCELSNEPRRTSILYVCYPHGKNDILSLKETSTCNYEVIVLTSTLCFHPKFRPQEGIENEIVCKDKNKPVTRKPLGLLQMELDSLQTRYEILSEHLYKVESKEGTLQMELVNLNKFGKFSKSSVTPLAEQSNDVEKETPKSNYRKDIKDTSPVEAFLQGKNCLNGGTGWWKYEFCYGRYVRQYHVDKSGETSLILGFFDEPSHIDWITKNPNKKPKPVSKRTQLTHFYHGGSICDKTGKKRQTEVKLKCLENSSSPASVSLYLLEPQTCQYILGVESPLICDILHKADTNGLVKKEITIPIESEETPAEYIVENPRLEND